MSRPLGFVNSVGLMKPAPSIVGTWRLRTFHTWNAAGEMCAPLGIDPIGYAHFDEKGRVFVQIAKRPDASATLSDGERRAVAESFSAYFGQYTINRERSILRMRVEGSNLADYIGSTQHRVFELTDDTLTLGEPGKYRAVADRA